MIKQMTAFAAVLLLMGAGGAEAASRNTSACNRACLQGAMTAYLSALVKHDPAAAPFAADVRFTENTKDLKPGEGLWTTAGPLAGFREDFLDTRAGIAGSHVVIDDGGKPALLAVRLKVVGHKITEVETQVTETQPQGQQFRTENLQHEDPKMAYMPKKSERMTREALVKASDAYPEGLKAGSFVKSDAPFAPDAARNENGGWAAGPPCTRRPDCKDIKTQPLGPPRTHFQDRVLLVDEQAGIVWRRMSWLPPGGKDTRLVAFEVFKIWGGQIHAVEAFLRNEPLDSVSGWGA